MKHLLPAFATALALAMPSAIAANDAPQPMVELGNGVKTFYPNRMGYPATASLADVLQASPEMVYDRNGELSPNFVLKVDGNDYVQNAHLYLQQTSVREVQSVAIITDASVGPGKQGIQGVIEVTTRMCEEGISGYSNAAASTRGHYSLASNMGWRKGNWQISGTLSAMHHRSTTDECQYASNNGTETLSQTIHTKATTPSQFARLKTDYNDGRDRFNLSLVQSYRPGKYTITTTQGTSESVQKKNDQVLQMKASTSYGHTFSPAFNLGMGCGIEWVNKPASSTVEASSSTGAPYTERFPNHSIVVDPSVNFNYHPFDGFSVAFNTGTSFKRIKQGWHESDPMSYAFVLKVQEVNPVLQLSYNCGQHWTFAAGERLMYRNYDVSETSKYQPAWQSDYLYGMTNARVTFRPTMAHSLQAGYSRRVKIPDVEQLYPYFLLIVPSNHNNYSGNSDLQPVIYNVFDLSYVYTSPRLSASAGIRYYDVKNQLENVYDRSIYMGGLNKPGYIVNYYKWQNVGKARSYELSTSLVANYDWIAFTAGFNMVSEKLTSIPDDDMAYSWAMRLCPVIKLPKGFTISSEVSYFSRKESLYSGTDPMWQTQLRVGKSAGRFDFCIQWDRVAGGNIRTYTLNKTPGQVVVTNRHNQQLIFSAAINY
ncbi:MAG: TonB-dependent receptor [Bacteroidales bacterium]|nr:TonB-dependent receptor [Bacteroidales bacterium]